MIITGLLVFLGLTYYHPRRARLISGDGYLNAVFTALFVGVVGGRVLSVIADWHSFAANPIEIFYPWVGGFVVLGAILGIVIVMPLYLKWQRAPVLPLFDFVAVYAPLLQSIARFGCLLAGCCYGAVATASTWWTVTFTNPEAHIPPALLGVPLLPTQIYASMASATIFVIMLLLRKRFAYQGQAIMSYLLCENVARFAVDFWRGDRGELFTVVGLQLSRFQMYSGLFFIICAAGFIFVTMRAQRVTID
jgi:phosphatidylglycerol:prolipoprotein diacylglycerol transferase